MKLAQIQIEQLRSLRSLRFNLHPHLNIIEGPNGSGKTSFLEAIYLLGSGHSFRTREISPLITQNEACLTVFARTIDGQRISIQKSLSTPTQVRINGQPCFSSSELAHFLPCQVFYQDIFQIIDAGPAVRRGLLDWGLFHVKHDYHSLWKEYKRALKQRNALLRQKAKAPQLVPWNKILAELAFHLHQLRADYFEALNRAFQQLLKELSSIECSLAYYKGWDRKESGKTLEAILAENYQQDLARQFTQYGAHQADLLVHSEDFKAKAFLSRGQQKIVLFALKLAQAKLSTKHCIFLCDDLSSELDEEHSSKLLQLIQKTEGQFFITSIDANALLLPEQNDAFTFHSLSEQTSS